MDDREVIVNALRLLGISVDEANSLVTGHKTARVTHSMAGVLGMRNSSKDDPKPLINANKSPRTPKQPNVFRSKDNKKYMAKSPFGSTKRKAELRKSKMNAKTKVFGRSLLELASVQVCLSDGSLVSVPHIVVDICKLIRQNSGISVEGVFRKAGSTQRQNDIKKIIDGGNNLSPSVHPIDAACLLKQFLRSLPEPIFSADVHVQLIKSMNLHDAESKLRAITLCCLLLPEVNQHLLAFLMEFFYDVSTLCHANLMHARNLAIVLAPNLLPMCLAPPPPVSKKRLSTPFYEDDSVLVTNIEIIELLIDNGRNICRAAELSLLRHGFNQSVELVDTLVDNNHMKAHRKKRRSASIHRLMTGLRRVVGQAVPSSPLRGSVSAESLDSTCMEQKGGPSLRSPSTKRTSADAFDLESARDWLWELGSPYSKRLRVEVGLFDSRRQGGVEVNVAYGKSSVDLVSDDTNYPAHGITSHTEVGGAASSSTPKKAKGTTTSEQLGWDNLPDLGITRPRVKRAQSIQVKRSLSARIGGLHKINSGLSLVGSRKGDGVGHVKSALGKTLSMAAGAVVQQPVDRRGFNVDGRPAYWSPRLKVSHSLPLPGLEHHPDGAASPLGPRGIHDGAEHNLRQSGIVSASASAIDVLEKQYDDIKSIVRYMEDEVDRSNVENLTEDLFGSHLINSSENISCSEMIQNAYEKMTLMDLSASPRESLTRRLGVELKSRNRRSGEYRVIRSPSERKIGTIRRRSKEMVQTVTKELINEDPVPVTPLLKEALLQTPLNTTLRRGKPNSVKSGLPFVVRSVKSPKVSCVKSPKLKDTGGREIKVSRRKEESSALRPLSVSDSALTDDEKVSRSGIRRFSLNCSVEGNQSSLFDTELKNISGSETQRSRSLLTNKSSPMPVFNLMSSLNCSPGNLNIEVDGTNQILSMDETAQLLPSDNCQWQPAEHVLRDLDSWPLVANDDGSGRPSIAALMRQRKVTANVQLFNNLRSVTPIHHRRLTRSNATPAQLTFVTRAGHHLHETPKNSLRKVSPLKERSNNRIHYQSLESESRECANQDAIFKTPLARVSPRQSFWKMEHLKSPSVTPSRHSMILSPGTPPQLPPKGLATPTQRKFR